MAKLGIMTSLWHSVTQSSLGAQGAFHATGGSLRYADLAQASCIPGGFETYRGQSVLLTAHDQLSAAIALLELDGVATRIVLCTPDLSADTLAQVAAVAATGAVLENITLHPHSGPIERRAGTPTEWVLLTSGTTGAPKLVVHSLASLGGTLPRQPPGTGAVWSTFYDIRRYGGLQIYLRAVLSGTPLVLSDSKESTPDFLARAARHGVTHISGTPSHWRRALMSGAAKTLQPAYVRLSGEVADQVLLDQLKDTYPRARIAHAFASTEAGVAFDVDDGLAGFPAEYLEGERNGITMKVEEGTLRIRSARTAARYLGTAAQALDGGDGFVDTGDLVELKEGRYYFRGRQGGIINVGGLKVYPEEVEGVLNADPRVRMSLVRSRRNPITGAIVVADVVLADTVKSTLDDSQAESIKSDLLQACRGALPAHKVPAKLSFVPALEITAAGKLVRPNA
jgi:acyl-coenzyme A synthetase/AMP-(fatty) acid ligase